MKKNETITVAVPVLTPRAVLVTTDKRGVFFGYTTDPPTSTVITLARARMIVYWSSETRGILGLAANGPAKGSRVTPQVPSLTLQGVTAVGDCTERAAEMMEKGTWS